MSTATLTRLADQRAAAWAAFQEADKHAQAPGATADQQATADAALDEVERLDNAVHREERRARLGASIEAEETSIVPRQGGSVEDANGYADAFDAYLRRGTVGMSASQVGAIQNAQGVGTTTAGGYTVPEGFLTRMVETMKAYGGLLGEAETITTAEGNDLVWPTNDDTANIGEILAENTQVNEQDLTFGQVNLGAYLYSSRAVRVSFQLLQDSAFNLDAWLPNRLGVRIGRALAAHLVSGTGTGQPQGLVTALDAGAVDTATAATLAFDDLIEVEHAVDPAYRTTGIYVIADGALKAIRKLKDSQGQYLWQPAPSISSPSTINGRRYVVDNNMTGDLSAGSVPVIFGDIRTAYVVRQVTGARVLRLVERYADFHQVGFFGYARFDAVAQDTAAAKALKIAAV